MSKTKPIWYLTAALGVVAIVGYGASAISIIATLVVKRQIVGSFCARSECIETWFRLVEYSLLIAKVTSDFLVVVATVGGIIVALLSYFSNLNNSALSNHISHYGIFQSYVEAEIGKRNRIEYSSVDTFCWYNKIFSQSRAGDMKTSQQYGKYMAELGSLISQSNNLVSSATTEAFRFKPHQERMIGKLKEIGIAFAQQPRLEFYEIEDQIISLVACVNQAFCSSSGILGFQPRIYL
jgi:hypothetical protein